MLFLYDLAMAWLLLLYLTARAAYHIAGGKVTSLLRDLRVSTPFGEDSVRRYGMVERHDNSIVAVHNLFLLHVLCFFFFFSKPCNDHPLCVSNNRQLLFHWEFLEKPWEVRQFEVSLTS